MRALQYPFAFAWGGTAEVVNAGSWLKQSIIQWIITDRRERVHRPGYGGDVRALLYANQDEAEVREELNRITDAMRERFRVDVLNARAVSDEGTLHIIIDYAVGGVPDQLFVDITDVIT